MSPLIVRIGDASRGEALPLWKGEHQFVASDWSSDGRRLAGALLRPTGMNGIVVYTLASGEYQQLTEVRTEPPVAPRQPADDLPASTWPMLWDGRTREVLSVPPYEIDDFVGLSSDSRAIVFALIRAEADIWVMDLP